MLFRTIRSRLMVTGALVVGSVFALKPSNTVQRIRDAATGRMKDTTVRRVPINLGLDLQGGIHLSLEVDQSKGPVPDCADAISRAERVVRSRIDQFGTTEPVVQIIGRCRLVVELPGEKDPARAKSIIQRTAFLEFRITDMQNLFRDALPEIDRALREAGVQAPGQTGAGAANVAQLFGPDTTKAKKGKAAAKGKAAKDTTDLNAPGALSSLLFQSPINMPGEFLVPEEQAPVAESLLARPEVKRLIPRGIELKWGTELASRGARAYRALYAVEDRPIITGEELEKATARRDQVTNQSVVDFVLSRSGGRKFERETGRHVGHYMAIILDGRAQGQPPIIKSQIGQHGQIELGSKPLQEAQDLALVLRAGALPAPPTIDDNVLSFQRIREELQHGKLVRTAVDEGFKHAMSAIVDSNVSTALTAGILYLVGTGPVRGFAVTLIIGIGASMITAIFVVRTFYMIWLQRRPDMATLSV